MVPVVKVPILGHCWLAIKDETKDGKARYPFHTSLCLAKLGGDWWVVVVWWAVMVEDRSRGVSPPARLVRFIVMASRHCAVVINDKTPC